jgi:hypothetical protein
MHYPDAARLGSKGYRMIGKRFVRSTMLALVFGAAGLVGVKGWAATSDTAGSSQNVVFALPSAPPKGAVVLFSGKPEELHDLWYRRYSKESPVWTVEKGIATPQRSDITSRQEFGDQFVHVEFRCPADENGNQRGGGNAGVGLQGRYEIQIYGDYGHAPEATGAGALYNQTAARVNASKKAGEWQTYDILFRAPRFDADGKVIEPARATVFQNGILVQNNEAFHGPTGIQYSEYRTEAKTGPLVLQGDHDPVQYRNVWVVPF